MDYFKLSGVLLFLFLALLFGEIDSFGLSDTFKAILTGGCNLFGRCKSHQRCNPNTLRCSTNPPPTNRTHFWTDCEVSSYVCPLFGFETDTWHQYGVDGEWCMGGSKIRCVAPEPPALPPPTPINQLKILSYNIWDRPLTIIHDGQRERTCHIPYWIRENIPDIDVITLQEAFNGGCWPSANFYTIFAELGFPYHSNKLTKSPRLINGGTIIFSRWPIETEDSIVYSARRSFSGDYFAAKGVNYVKINKTVDGRSKFYHIMTSHFQSGRGGDNDKIRNKQAREWKGFIDGLQLPEYEPLILTGDINIDFWTQRAHLQDVMDTLFVDVINLVGPLNFTFDTRLNYVAETGSKGDYIREWLDYIMFSQIHGNPRHARQRILQPKTKEEIPVCWCNMPICPRVFRKYKHAGRCRHVKNFQDLSDHQPVLGEFIF